LTPKVSVVSKPTVLSHRLPSVKPVVVARFESTVSSTKKLAVPPEKTAELSEGSGLNEVTTKLSKR
jgi:hypothetical protein